MKAYTIYLGLTTRSGEDLTQTLNDNQILRMVTEILKGYNLPGASITTVNGLWRGKVERSIAIYVCAAGLDCSIDDLCGALAHDFEQEEVGYHESPVLHMVPNPTL